LNIAHMLAQITIVFWHHANIGNQIFSQLMWWEYQPNIVPRLVRVGSVVHLLMYEHCLCNILAILNEYFTNIKQAVKLATYWNNMLHMSAQYYEHRFGYCTNAKTCFNVHFRPILAERRVLLGISLHCNFHCSSMRSTVLFQ